jgi:hypothetical protein
LIYTVEVELIESEAVVVAETVVVVGTVGDGNGGSGRSRSCGPSRYSCGLQTKFTVELEAQDSHSVEVR